MHSLSLLIYYYLGTTTYQPSGKPSSEPPQGHRRPSSGDPDALIAYEQPKLKSVITSNASKYTHTFS